MNHEYIHWFITFVAYSTDDLDIIWKCRLSVHHNHPPTKLWEGNVFSCVCLFTSHDTIGQSQVTWDLSSPGPSPGPVTDKGLPTSAPCRHDQTYSTWTPPPRDQMKSSLRLKGLHVWMGKQDWENIYHRKKYVIAKRNFDLVQRIRCC